MPRPFIALLCLLFGCASCVAVEITTRTTTITPPTAPILVFARTQCHKYWHLQNYLHWWNDRPLATDRSTRPFFDGSIDPTAALNAVMDSMARDAELAKGYQFDGLCSVGNTFYQEPAYELALEALARAGTTGATHLLEFSNDLTDLTYARAALTKALASPYATRINGKVLISTYAMDSYGASNIASRRQTLRNEFGNTFVLVVEMTKVAEEMNRLYQLGQLSTAPSANLTAIKQLLRTYLDASDGIMVENCHHMEVVSANRYDNRFALSFYRDCLIPIFTSVLAEPAYTSKLLGLGAVAGYCNERTGDNNSEECTRRLRDSLQTAIAASPDFILMAEWNEQNENTHLQPTVTNSWTHRRIIEHCLRTAKGLPLAPRSGDDTAIPNCIISYRKEIKLGEQLEIELLNVPDSTSTSTYTATLSLEDAAGATIQSFLPVSFTRSTMQDWTFAIPSETLVGYPIVRPVLRIQQATAPTDRTWKDGLLHVTIRPTWVLDYHTVKQPLRDQAPITTATLQVTGTSGRNVTLQASVTASEPLTSVEIVADGTEVYAYDRLNEYDLANNVVIAGYYTTRPGGYDCDLTVSGTSGFQFKSVFMPEGLQPYQRIGSTIRFDAAERNREWPARFYLVIPKTSQATAVIQITSSHGNFSVPVADVLAQGAISVTPVGQLVFRFDRFDALPDHPVSIDAPSASFTTTVRAETDRLAYHLRIITASGRIHRTRPLPVSLSSAGAPVPLAVFSEAQSGAAVPVSVPRNDVLDLRYEFDDRCRDALPVPAGPRWFAQLGGGTLYADPFYRTDAGYPIGSQPRSAPTWATEDGAPSLRFNGNGQYLVLPPEAFPRGAFTWSCEIKPMVSTPQILFRHHGILIGSFMLRLANGTLSATHVDKLAQESTFSTGLTVPTGQWSRIVMTYDLNTLSFQVGNQPVRSYPFNRKALFFQPSAFGGHLVNSFGVLPGDGFFNGYLKSLRITHAAQLPPAGNTAPIAWSQSATTAPGVGKLLTLTGSDADGDLLTVTISSPPANGTLSGTPPRITYTPAAGHLGADVFSFTVSDGTATSAPATVTVTTATGGGGGGGSSGSGSGGGGGGCGAGGTTALGLLLSLCWCGHRISRARPRP